MAGFGQLLPVSAGGRKRFIALWLVVGFTALLTVRALALPVEADGWVGSVRLCISLLAAATGMLGWSVVRRSTLEYRCLTWLVAAGAIVATIPLLFVTGP